MIVIKEKKTITNKNIINNKDKKQSLFFLIIFGGLLLITTIYIGKASYAYIKKNHYKEYGSELEDVPEITAEELKSFLDKDKNSTIIIDVRAFDDFEWEHIENSINIPLNELEFYYDELEKSKTIVTVCDNTECEYSYIAARRLMRNGFKDIYALKGGFPEWRDNNFAIEKSEEAQRIDLIAKVPPITEEEINENRNKYLLLDIRKKELFDKEHLTGANWLSLDSFDEAMTEMPKNKAIVIISNSEDTSLLYGAKLYDNNFLGVRFLRIN